MAWIAKKYSCPVAPKQVPEYSSGTYIGPQCGYRHEKKRTAPKKAAVEAPSERGLGRLFIKAMGLIPRPKRAKWALVLYRRDA